MNPNKNIFAAHSSGIAVSYDNGINWNSALALVETVCLSIKDSATIFAGMLANEGVFRSTNNGTNWIKTDSGITNKNIVSLLATDSFIYAGTFGSGVFRSGNNGDFWEFSGLNNKRVYALYETINGHIFAGTDSTIFRSVDNGITWNSINIITSIYNNEASNSNPSFSLLQNYPNPFNPSTVIKYKISESRLTTLKVYDILGQEVTTLINEVKSPGEYSVELNAASGSRRIASGVYFYELRTGDFIQRKKMMLLK